MSLIELELLCGLIFLMAFTMGLTIGIKIGEVNERK